MHITLKVHWEKYSDINGVAYTDKQITEIFTDASRISIINDELILFGNNFFIPASSDAIGFLKCLLQGDELGGNPQNWTKSIKVTGTGDNKEVSIGVFPCNHLKPSFMM